VKWTSVPVQPQDVGRSDGRLRRLPTGDRRFFRCFLRFQAASDRRLLLSSLANTSRVLRGVPLDVQTRLSQLLLVRRWLSLGGFGLPLRLTSTWHPNPENNLSSCTHVHARAPSDLSFLRRTKAHVRQACTCGVLRGSSRSGTSWHTREGRRGGRRTYAWSDRDRFVNAASASFAPSPPPQASPRPLFQAFQPSSCTSCALRISRIVVLARTCIGTSPPHVYTSVFIRTSKRWCDGGEPSSIGREARVARADESRKASRNDACGGWRTLRRRRCGPGGAWRGFRRRGRAFDVARDPRWSGRCARRPCNTRKRRPSSEPRRRKRSPSTWNPPSMARWPKSAQDKKWRGGSFESEVQQARWPSPSLRTT